jgi:hypothetical protein
MTNEEIQTSTPNDLTPFYERETPLLNPIISQRELANVGAYASSSFQYGRNSCMS